MQRKATKQSRGPSSRDRQFIGWVKEQPCCVCDHHGPSIVDHIAGSTAKVVVLFVRIQYGLFAVIPLCQNCDNVKTRGSRKKFKEEFGCPYEKWFDLIQGTEWEVKFTDIEKEAMRKAA